MVVVVVVDNDEFLGNNAVMMMMLSLMTRIPKRLSSYGVTMKL